MHIIFFCISLLIFSAINVSGQVRVGAKAGLVYSGSSNPSGGNVGELASSYIGLNYKQRHPGYSYLGGLMVNFKVGNLFTLRPNLFYKKKNWHDETISVLNDGSTRFEEDEVYKINCLEIPVHFLYNTLLGNGKLYVGTGPYFSYALNGKYLDKRSRLGSYTEWNIEFDNPASTPPNRNLHRIDYGLSSIIGYEFAFGLLIDFGYDLGLRKMFLDPDVPTDPDSKYNIFNLSAGYLFSRKRE